MGGQASSGIASGMPTPPTQYAPSRRVLVAPAATSQVYNSPTDSEFSDSDGPDAVKNWDEDRVCDYLRSVKCGDYEKLFRKNHINGENLLEMDKEVLKEMGIDKVGDRVRLFLGIKKLRTKTYASQKRRNRVCFLCFVFLVLLSAPPSPLPVPSGSLPRSPSHTPYRNLSAVWISSMPPPRARPDP